MNSFVSQYGKVSIHVARSKSDFSRVNEFRERYGKVEASMEENFHQLEALRDEIGVVFSFYAGSQMIASLRYVPIGEKVSVTESLFPSCMSDYDFNLPTWEGTRFVVSPLFRGRGTFREALALSMEWLRDNTMCQKIVAPIRHKLFPLYEHYGFYRLASTSILINERRTFYTIIMSELITVLNQSASNGYQRSTPKYVIDVNPNKSNLTLMR